MRSKQAQLSVNQVKRLQKMKEFAECDKARNMNLKKLKEATAEIRNGVDKNEKNARKQNTDSLRAAYLVK